ncbi:MAG: hypothetical protein AAGB05_00730 [Pseudomonadota bacterium]
MSSEMGLLKRTAFATACAAAVLVALPANLAQAGKITVDPVGPVFVPPAFGAGGGSSGAASGAAGAATTAETEAVTDEGSVAQEAAAAAETRTQVAATVDGLVSQTQLCQALDPVYQVDCIADALDNASEALADTEGFEDAAAALAETSRSIEQVVRQNRDRSEPRVSASAPASSGQVATSRPLTPVLSDEIEEVQAEALQLVEGLETILLRSADASEERAAQFENLAEAVGSNKILLRS